MKQNHSWSYQRKYSEHMKSTNKLQLKKTDKKTMNSVNLLTIRKLIKIYKKKNLTFLLYCLIT